MSSLLDLTPAAVLAAEEDGVLARRRGDVEGMDRLLAWCDLHSGDPQETPGAVPVRFGGNRLIRPGGEGTPRVAELCFEEFAIAAHAGVIATKNKAADLLDLRHRLPNTYDAVKNLDLELWVARKTAALARRLTPAQAQVVDLAVATARHESPGRVLVIAEAKVIEADPAAHRARIAADEARQGVWLRRRRPGQALGAVDGATLGADVQGVGMRLSTAASELFHETTTAIATRLAEEHVPAHEDDVPTMDQFRARAVELMADPHAAARFLDGPDTEPEPQPEPEPAPEAKPPAPKRRRKPAEIVVHIAAEVLAGQCDGVARVEGIGPLLLEQVTDLLRGREVTVQPVIDLTVGRAVNGYEHPTTVKKRTELRTTRDVFPHSTRQGGLSRLDHDHPVPYVPPDDGGPPGQTGDHNDAPVGRTDHRAKTHLAYQVKQLGLGAYRWETPHGLARIVTGQGTRRIQLLKTTDGTTIGELYESPPWTYEPQSSGL
ncbi:hypothetical protein ACFQ0K_19060 [Nocardioides caeni]|uniref:hypothetical protein n=1 Tax=Nocardioides caeni TaxID=574700 RepID=UPI0031EA86AC